MQKQQSNNLLQYKYNLNISATQSFVLVHSSDRLRKYSYTTVFIYNAVIVANEVNSDLLLNSLLLFALIICSFSVKHRSHFLKMLLYDLAFEMIDHCMLQSLLLSLRSQMCFESSVLLAYFLFRNDCVCCVNRCLNVPSVRPM